MMLAPLSPREWEIARPYVEPLLDRLESRARGTQTAADVKARVFARTHDLWLLFDADLDPPVRALIGTRVRQMPSGMKMLEFEYCIGRDAIAHIGLILETLIDFARAQGCTRIGGNVAKGWGRILARQGFDVSHVCVEKEI